MKYKIKLQATMSPDGSTQINTVENGGMGSCQKITDKIIAEVGGVADEKSRHMTADYFAAPKTAVEQKIEVQ